MLVHVGVKRYPPPGVAHPADALYALLENDVFVHAQRDSNPVLERMGDETVRAEHAMQEGRVAKEFSRRKLKMQQIFRHYATPPAQGNPWTDGSEESFDLTQQATGCAMTYDQLLAFSHDFGVVSINKRNNWHAEGLLSKVELHKIFQAVGYMDLTVSFGGFCECLKHVADLGFSEGKVPEYAHYFPTLLDRVHALFRSFDECGGLATVESARGLTQTGHMMRTGKR